MSHRSTLPPEINPILTDFISPNRKVSSSRHLLHGSSESPFLYLDWHIRIRPTPAPELLPPKGCIAREYPLLTSESLLLMQSSGFLIAFFMGGLSYIAMCYAFGMPEIVPVVYRDEFSPTWEALGKSHG
jgi:hypothetical protein